MAVKDSSEITGKLVRCALGNVAFIGELYDARTEMFCSRSLFSSSFPTHLIKNQQNSKCMIDYSYSDQLSERFSLLKVQAELQLSILLGVFTLEGHGKYLEEEKKSERTVSCSLLYNLSTVCEKLIVSFKEIEEYIDTDVFEDDEYTHVVAEINWGANCTVILEHQNSDTSKKTEVEGMLKAELKSIAASIKPKVGGNYDAAENSKTKSFHLKVYADVLPEEGIPNSVEKASEFISKLPELVKTLNDGKGKPLNYVMIPISTFMKISKYDKTVSRAVKSVDECFVIKLVSFFEELTVLKQRLHDLQNDFSRNQKYVSSDCLSQIRRMLQNIKVNEARLKTDLAEDLPNVRAGKIAMADLIKKAEKYQSSDLKLSNIENFIDEFSMVVSKLDEIDVYASKNIIYLGKNENLDSLMIKNTNHDFFVLYTSKKLKEKNPDLTRKSLNFFLSKAEDPDDNEQYIVVDFDVNSTLAREVKEVKIVHYKNGCLISSDVYRDKEIPAIVKNEPIIRKNHKENRPYENETDIEENHFPKENPTNWAKLVNSFDMDYVPDKPDHGVLLRLPCPGYTLKTCSTERLLWKCNVCQDNLHHCFDDHFYCSCGKAQSQSYELKCCSFNHGDKYLSVNLVRNELPEEECFLQDKFLLE